MANLKNESVSALKCYVQDNVTMEIIHIGVPDLGTNNGEICQKLSTSNY